MIEAAQKYFEARELQVSMKLMEVAIRHMEAFAELSLPPESDLRCPDLSVALGLALAPCEHRAGVRMLSARTGDSWTHAKVWFRAPRGADSEEISGSIISRWLWACHSGKADPHEIPADVWDAMLSGVETGRLPDSIFAV